jgi:hypothetical protein
VGHGFGTYADALPPQKTAAEIYRVEHAENDWLELIVEGGTGAFVLAALGLAMLVRVAAHRLKERDRVSRGLVCGALGALAGTAVHALFDFPFHIPAVTLFVAAAALLTSSTAGPLAHRGRTPALLMGGVVLVSAVALPLGTRLPQPIASRELALRAAETSDGTGRRLRLEMAEAAARRDIERRPADPVSWLMLAWLRRAADRPDVASRLAGHAASLDPQNPELLKAVRPFASSGSEQ